MKHLGTILPDPKTMAIADAVADANRRRDDAKIRKALPHCTRKVVGGEVRYYDTTDQYAIMSRQGTIIWFAVRADGDYRI